MNNSKNLVYRIAEKLDQSEKGYSVPKITYLDNHQYHKMSNEQKRSVTLLVEYPSTLSGVTNAKKYIINVTEISDLS